MSTCLVFRKLKPYPKMEGRKGEHLLLLFLSFDGSLRERWSQYSLPFSSSHPPVFLFLLFCSQKKSHRLSGLAKVEQNVFRNSLLSEIMSLTSPRDKEILLKDWHSWCEWITEEARCPDIKQRTHLTAYWYLSMKAVIIMRNQGILPLFHNFYNYLR